MHEPLVTEFRTPQPPMQHTTHLLGCEANFRDGAVEDHELRLEEDVAVDGEPDAGVRLDATEAACKEC